MQSKISDQHFKDHEAGLSLLVFLYTKAYLGPMDSPSFSRLPRFFEASILERRALLADRLNLMGDFSLDQGLTLDAADEMSENVIATFSLPLSVAANFVVDGQPVLVPMVTEEPSIVAACSKMAKIVAWHQGFKTKIDPSLLLGQIQLYRLRDIDHSFALFTQNQELLIEKANSFCPNMVKRGGGVINIGARVLASPMGPMLIIEPLMDVVDSMGANAINTVLEGLSEHILAIFGGQVGLKILSNYCDQRLAQASCEIPFKNLAQKPGGDDGYKVAEKLLFAHALAEVDIYRATTHNKGIMNGIDAVALASGNDFRAIEAAAHAYASKNGAYRALTSLSLDTKRQMLKAELTLPLGVGVVGGITGFHPGVKLAHKILGENAHSAQSLSAVMVSVGLAQCLAALLALSQEGIQQGHMKLHHKKALKGRGA